jgi:hypothetical protein
MDRRNEVTGEEIELDEDSPSLTSGGSVTQALAPTDSGKDAYMVLAGCFLAEVFTWGMVLGACSYLTKLLILFHSAALFLWRVSSLLHPS